VNRYEWLKNTDCFKPSALKHIFEGDLKGMIAVGYHYEGLPNTGGSLVPGTETVPNSYGVYEAQVRINGVLKLANGGFSSFFPRFMSPQEVVDSINEAYNVRDFVQGNMYEGTSSSGMKIYIYLDVEDKIISAFPVYWKVRGKTIF